MTLLSKTVQFMRNLGSGATSLEELQAAREAGETRAREKRAAAAESRDFEREATSAAVAVKSRIRSAVAAACGVPADLVDAGLEARRRQFASSELAPIFGQLCVVLREPNTPPPAFDPVAVVEAFACLACDTLPFAAELEDDARRLKRFPSIATWSDFGSNQYGGGWYERWLALVGLTMPVQRRIRADPPEVFSDRVAASRKSGLYSDSAEVNDAAANAELTLLREAYKAEAHAVRKEATAATEAQRAGVVDVIDKVLARLPFGPAWFWTREFRRHVAGESPWFPHFAAYAPPPAWAWCQVLGVRFDFSNVKGA